MLFRLMLCAGCRFPSTHILCSPCEESLYWNQRILPSPSGFLEGIAPLLIAFDRTQSLIRRWKSTSGTSLRRTLFRMPEPLANSLLELRLFAITPIPQDQRRSYRRGQDSALEVAEFFATQLGLPLLPILGLRGESTPRQTGMSRLQRELSSNPFAIRQDFFWNTSVVLDLQDRIDRGDEIRILLVDDLITSGSTLAKASTTLQGLYPRIKCWAGTLGFRPRVQDGLASQWFRDPEQEPPPQTRPP